MLTKLKEENKKLKEEIKEAVNVVRIMSKTEELNLDLQRKQNEEIEKLKEEIKGIPALLEEERYKERACNERDWEDKEEEMREELEEEIKELKEENEKLKKKVEYAGEHTWSDHKQKLINEYMEMTDGWEFYREFLVEHHPDELEDDGTLYLD